MSSIINDGTLTRGSIDIVIGGVTYTLLDYKRTGGKVRTEVDYTAAGKPRAASHAEELDELSGTIRMRSDQAAPPKYTSFAYDSKNWYIVEREESGSTTGLKEYQVRILEQVGASVTVT